MRLSPRLALILTAVAVFVAVVVLAAVLVVPQFGKLGDLEQQIDSADDAVSQAENLLKARQQAKDDAAFTDAALLELAAAVPENPDLPSLIIELQDVAYQSNVQLRGIEPGEMVQNAGYVTMPVSVTVWGDWADTVDFVQRTQKLTRQVRMFEVASQVLDEGDNEEAVEDLEPYSVETQLIVETYVIPATSDATATVPPAAPAQ
jgi:type IV pilus assembly protein PilO